MQYEKFIQPKEIGIGDRTFAISRIPALDAQQLYNVISKSVTDNGLIGITMLPPPTIEQILGYTALFGDDKIWLTLSNKSIINEVFQDDFGELQQLVVAMVKENFDFVVSGKLLDQLVEGEEAATDSAS